MSDNNEITTAKSIEDMIADLYKGKNAVKLDEDVYRTQINGERPTNKAMKQKKKQVLKMGRFICPCGFAFKTLNGDNKGGENMKIKVRLHLKVCPSKK